MTKSDAGSRVDAGAELREVLLLCFRPRKGAYHKGGRDTVISVFACVKAVKSIARRGEFADVMGVHSSVRRA
jgi:hypothetical protein